MAARGPAPRDHLADDSPERVVELPPLERFYERVDDAVAHSIDSRFPGLVKDLAEAVARAPRLPYLANFNNFAIPT